GYKYEEQVKILKRFDALCTEQFPDECTVTKRMMDIWAVKSPTESPGTLRNRVTVVSHLAQHITSLGLEAYIYPTNELPKEPKYTPYIFSEDELVRFFRQTDCCHFSPEAPNRHFIMPVLFRILYCCGLRPGEALRLEVNDVDLERGVLLIRESKNGNDRYVPMSFELSEICKDYASKVHNSGTEHKYFFPALDEGMISLMNMYSNFHRFLYKAGISFGGRGKGPRIYDFRHTFAVHCLRRIVLSGKDIAAYHQALKTYMGHSFFKYTAYYLRLTNDMFPDIRQKMESYYLLNIEEGGSRHE
ncbi:MAG: tyrosine-type recombinase/integrase, partial [Agathobacter sp.]